jgi:hypothetical protein
MKKTKDERETHEVEAKEHETETKKQKTQGKHCWFSDQKTFIRQNLAYIHTYIDRIRWQTSQMVDHKLGPLSNTINP